VLLVGDGRLGSLVHFHPRSAGALPQAGRGRPEHYRDRVEHSDGKLSVAVRQALVKEYRKSPAYRGGLAENYLNSGLARCALGDPTGAAADVRRALGLYDVMPRRSDEKWFLSACSHATLTGLASQPGSGVSAAEGEEGAARGIGALRKAVGMSYRSADAYRNDDALDPLRGHDDFKLLMMDVAMPAAPFAPAPRAIWSPWTVGYCPLSTDAERRRSIQHFAK
jgi:hypothetical protein